MPNNTKDIFYAIYCLINLVTLEAGDQDALVDVIHFCFEIQVNTVIQTKYTLISFLQSTITKTSDEHQKKPTPMTHYCIHALIAAYFNLMSKLYGITEFFHHVDEVNRLNSDNNFRLIYLDNSYS
jgi:hypothetical protein